MNTIEQRVAALERSNGRLTLGLILVTVCLGLACFVALQRAFDSSVGRWWDNGHRLFSTHELYISNGQGESVVEIGTNDAGGGVLIVKNGLGKEVVHIGTTKSNSGGVSVNDFDGNPKRSLYGG